MAFALPCSWDCASVAVDQQPKRSRNRGCLRMRLLRLGAGGRSEVARIYKEPVPLRIKSHVAGAKFRFDGLDNAEFIGRIFVKDMQRAFPCGDEEQGGGRF